MPLFNPLRSNTRSDRWRALRNTAGDNLLGLGDDLLAWWAADDGATGAPWLDRLNGYAMTPVGSPVWSATSWNGSPSFTYNGTSQYHTMESFPFPTIDFEVWALARCTETAGTAGNRFITNMGASGTNASAQLVRQVSNAVYASATLTLAGTDRFMTTRHLVRGTYAPTLIGLQLDDGTLETAAATPALVPTRVNIGVNTAKTAAWWLGDIRDVVVIRSSASAAKKTALQATMLARRNL